MSDYRYVACFRMRYLWRLVFPHTRFTQESNAWVREHNHEIVVILPTCLSEIGCYLEYHQGSLDSCSMCNFYVTGGGFGGKETRFNTLALPVAVAAVKMRRSVRAMLDRDEDMIMTGTRHPFYAKYKVKSTVAVYAISCHFLL